MRNAVIITGGAKRVGATLARHFAQAGYDIALHYNRSGAPAKKLKTELEKTGIVCHLFQHDLSDTAGLPALMKSIQKSLPHCTALINNASIFERAPLMDTSEALFDRQLTINLKAPFFLTQAFAQTFKKGAVINILDTDISKTHPSHFAYLLSKKSLADVTLMAARELGPHIRVNGVCPGYVLPHSAQDAASIKKVEKTLPLKEHAKVDEIAQAVIWLCRQKSITGQILYVDGGKHA